MNRKLVFTLMLLLVFGLMTVVPAVAQDEFVFGMVLIGPKNDGGWSQAHFEGGQYVEAKVAGTKMVYADIVLPDKFEDAISNLVSEGAKLIFTTSDDFEEATSAIAPQYPDVTFINVSGDDAYTGEAPANLGNIMGTMEWGKLMAGCAAALTTETGQIGYLGPLINFETRRLASSAYLGARYCYEKYRGKSAADLTFSVVWIGFWFYNPDMGTLDPTAVTNQFFDEGKDVVISGIDTTEAITVAGQRVKEGEKVWAIPYDFAGACDIAPDACLGVPYFHWGPAYAELVTAFKEGTYKQEWKLIGPDWTDINNPDTSAIGFVKGPALSEEASKSLDAFIAELAAYATDKANADTVFLWEGPLNYQDGTEIAAEGVKLPYIAPHKPETPSIWYLEQLLEGMIGASAQ